MVGPPNAHADEVFWKKLIESRDHQFSQREWLRIFPDPPSYPITLFFSPVLGEIASVVRWEATGLPLEIRENSDGSYSALPPEDSEYDERHDDLSVEDVQLHRLDWDKMVKLLASSFALWEEPKLIHPHLWRLGFFESIGKRCYYYFCLAKNVEWPDLHISIQKGFHAFVLCPINNPPLLKALSSAGLSPILFSDVALSSIIQATYPRTFDWNGKPFSVELPVMCLPYYHPFHDWYSEWRDLLPDELPSGYETTNLCELFFYGEAQTIVAHVCLEHPFALFPTHVVSAPNDDSKPESHKGFVCLNTKKFQARFRIFPTETDIKTDIILNREAQRASGPVKHLPHTQHSPTPLFSLRQFRGTWELVFDGEKASIKHEKGLLLVEYLLKNPPQQPVHVCEIEAEVCAVTADESGITVIEDPETGERITLGRNSQFHERNLGLDDQACADRLWQIRRKSAAVEDDPDASELERQEASQLIEQIDEYLRKSVASQTSNAAKACDRVRKAISRLIRNLNEFKDNQGNGNDVYHAFADHLQKHLIEPSSRYSGTRSSRTRAKVAQTFTYEPPEGVTWSD